MHKNWILQKRKVCVTVFEILMPVIFGLLLLFIRNLISTDSFPNGKIWDNVKASELTSNFNKTEILYSPNTGKIVTIMSAMETEIKTKYPRITGKYFLCGMHVLLRYVSIIILIFNFNKGKRCNLFRFLFHSVI